MLLNTLQTSMRCLRCTSVLRSQIIEKMMKKSSYSSWPQSGTEELVNEEIILENPEVASGPRKYVNEEHRQRMMKARVRHRPLQKPLTKFVSDDTYKNDGSLNIHKFEEDHRTISTLIMTIKSKKLRDKKQKILLEGHRLIADAMRAGLKPEILLFSRTTDLTQLSLPEKGIKLYKVPYATLQLWSGLTTSPGIMGIFKAPNSFERETTIDTIPLTIICDNVREPGNLGSILRAAAGVGCERVILTKGCVDVWESKVLRSAAGAHFRVSISKSVEWEDVGSLISPTASIYIADSDPTMNDEEIIAEEIVVEEIESCKKKTDEESTMSLSSVEGSTQDDPTDETEIDDRQERSNENRKKLRKMEKAAVKELSSRIPVIPYYSADYATNEIVLIVGGETEGLSFESLALARNGRGIRVHVPLNNNVESLNTGMALGIVAFEIKRQFAIRKNSTVT